MYLGLQSACTGKTRVAVEYHFHSFTTRSCHRWTKLRLMNFHFRPWFLCRVYKSLYPLTKEWPSFSSWAPRRSWARSYKSLFKPRSLGRFDLSAILQWSCFTLHLLEWYLLRSRHTCQSFELLQVMSAWVSADSRLWSPSSGFQVLRFQSSHQQRPKRLGSG